MARFTAVAVAMLVVLGAGMWLFWYGAGLIVVPPGEQSRLRAGRLGEAVLVFARTNNRLPASLSELPKDPVDGKPYSTSDGWDRPLIYEIRPGDIVVLRSLGADALPGGSGDSADLEWQWSLRDPAGTSWATSLPPVTRPAR